MKTRWSRIGLWAVFCVLLGVVVYGFYAGKLFSQPVWNPAGEQRLIFLVVLYSSCFAAVSAWRRSLFVPLLVFAAVLFAVLSVGVRPLAAVAFLLFSALIFGRSILELLGDKETVIARGDDILALLLGLAVYIWAVGFLVRWPVNYPLTYAGLLAVPIVLRPRLSASCARRWFGLPGPVAVDGMLAHGALGIAGFLFLAHWLVVWKPEISADGLAMHLAIPAAIAGFHRFPFDPQHVVWAVMPMNGDWGFTAAYLLGGEYAARLFNFCLFALSAALVGSTIRRWLSATSTLLIVGLLASTPLVQQLSGSLMVENTWTVMLLGALLSLGRYHERERRSGLLAAAVLCGTAAATKYGALAFAAAMTPLVGLILIRMAKAGRREWRSGALLAAALFLVTAAPPYINAYWKTGNPVFPFVNNVFKSQYFDSTTPFVDRRFVTPLSWSTLYDMTFRSHLFLEAQDGALGFHYLFLLPLSFFLIRKDWPYLARAALWVSVASFLLTFGSQPNLRYAYPALVIALLPVAAALSSAKTIDRRFYKAACAASVAILLVNTYFIPSSGWYHKGFFLNTILNGGQRDRYILDSAPVRTLIRQLNVRAPGKPVAFVESNEIAGLQAKAYTNTWHNDAFVRRVNAAGSASDILQIMNELGITLLIAPTAQSGIVIRQVPLQSFLSTFTTPEFRYGNYYVASVKKQYVGMAIGQLPSSPEEPLQTAGPGSHDDAGTYISFSGSWTRDVQFEQPLDHTLTYANQAGSSFRLSFEGREVDYVYTKAANRGIASVTIDGEDRGEIDLYSAGTVWRARTTFGNLQAGTHILTVRVLGRKNPMASDYYVDLDALEVR